ncbi:unnamed protein product [Paramecium sonneborni]|uniref:OTU domain-containing protein n=1 Tax=Paramecium sonneborni TaxID=65129 RepID=A0A8S1M193_9CILI|nr:unnamed protein product [Paramecium sonneborni]
MQEFFLMITRPQNWKLFKFNLGKPIKWVSQFQKQSSQYLRFDQIYELNKYQIMGTFSIFIVFIFALRNLFNQDNIYHQKDQMNQISENDLAQNITEVSREQKDKKELYKSDQNRLGAIVEQISNSALNISAVHQDQINETLQNNSAQNILGDSQDQIDDTKSNILTNNLTDVSKDASKDQIDDTKSKITTQNLTDASQDQKDDTKSNISTQNLTDASQDQIDRTQSKITTQNLTDASQDQQSLSRYQIDVKIIQDNQNQDINNIQYEIQTSNINEIPQENPGKMESKEWMRIIRETQLKQMNLCMNGNQDEMIKVQNKNQINNQNQIDGENDRNNQMEIKKDNQIGLNNPNQSQKDNEAKPKDQINNENSNVDQQLQQNQENQNEITNQNVQIDDENSNVDQQQQKIQQNSNEIRNQNFQIVNENSNVDQQQQENQENQENQNQIRNQNGQKDNENSNVDQQQQENQENQNEISNQNVQIDNQNDKVLPKPSNQDKEDPLIPEQFLDIPQNPSRPDKQNYPQQVTLPKEMEVIKQIIDGSSKKRHVDQNMKSYLRDVQNEQELFKHYSIKALGKKHELKLHCNLIIPVRGDGNCFYTSFGYQLLRIVIYEYTDEEFNQFLNQYFQISFNIQFNQIKIPNEMQQKLLNHYKDRLIYIRNLEKNYINNEYYQQQLKMHFSAFELQDTNEGFVDGYFNPLTVIFLRNLCLHLVETDQDEQNNLVEKETLLKWEEECNQNEVVINLLAKHLKIHIKLIFFEKGTFIVNEYSKEYENEKRRIILLLQPGHYNVGIKV